MKFTFKKSKTPKGLASIGHITTSYIKLNGFEVGCILEKAPFKIRLMVIKKDIMEDGNPNCYWKWITLKKESKTLIEVKEFLNNNIDKILEKYKLIQEWKLDE
jgi:hypothetical protein